MPADVTQRRRHGDSVDLRDHADEIVWAASRAPSYRNTQPWLFRVAARQVEVYADRSRSCPAADPDDRELFLGLGAAVFGVRLAMSRLRVRPVVGLSRDHAHPDLAAVVVAAGHVHAPDEDDRLYDQLSLRRTIWTPFTDEPFPVELEDELADHIRHDGVAPRWLRRTCTRRLIADLARRAATERLKDPALRLETARWPTAIPSPEPAPAVLAICTPSDHRADWLRAGQAMHHALLAASAAGIAGAFLSPLIEVPLLRRQLRSELDLPGCPQVLLGLGRPQEPLPPPPARRSSRCADPLRSFASAGASRPDLASKHRVPAEVVTVTIRAEPPRDHAGLEVLGYEECLRLAGSEPVGRIAFAEGGDIHVFPVNHRVLDGLVAFLTADGTKLGAAVEGSVVAFEVDRYDPDSHTGWSVLIKGRAELLGEGTLQIRLRTAGLRPWRNRVARPEWVVIRPDTVTGRRL